MASGWSTKRVLITVRTYPVPANKGAETSCTAGVTDDGRWMRIFPVPYRSLPPDKKFAKYQWIEAEFKKARSDARPESHNINIETIKLGSFVPTADGWAGRTAILRPLMRPSLCSIKKEREANQHPTLGLFRPKTIKRLVIEKGEADWTSNQKTILSQQTLGFAMTPREELQKIPFDFYYEFACDDPQCSGHKVSCTDWEMSESYRKWRKEYGANWEAKFRERYERGMIEKYDTQFYVGTMHGHPGTWLIVGLYYPPPSEPDLFG